MAVFYGEIGKEGNYGASNIRSARLQLLTSSAGGVEDDAS